MLEGDEGTNCPRLCRFFFGDSLRSKINIWGTREALFTSSQCTSTFWTDIEPEEVVDFGLLWSMHQGRLHFRWNLNDLNGPKWSWWSAASEGGGGTPLYKLYRYVPPHRISSLRSRRLEIVVTRNILNLTDFVKKSFLIFKKITIKYYFKKIEFRCWLRRGEEKTRVPGENLSKQKIQREPTTLPGPTNC